MNSTVGPIMQVLALAGVSSVMLCSMALTAEANNKSRNKVTAYFLIYNLVTK